MSDFRPHICFVAPHAFPMLSSGSRIEQVGGAELQQVLVARGLAERGYPVSMICMDFGQPDRLQIDGVTVFKAFRPYQGIPVIRFLWPRLTSLWRCMQRANADVYYQRTAGMLTGVVAAFCKRHRKKSIFAAAGNPEFDPVTPRIPYARDRWIYRYGLRNVDRILVQNEEQAKRCLRNYGRESVRIPNCYPPPLDAARPSEKYVLWVSTLRRLKRPELFLDLAEALPEHRFRMIGGPAPEDARFFEPIRRRAKQISNLDFLGFIPYAEIGAHFDGASLLINTSESEGFPNTFLQAWARGIPTIAYIDAGARLGSTPIGYQVHCFSELVCTVSGILSDTAKHARQSDLCLRYYESNHTPDRILTLYEQLFAELLVPTG